MDIIQTIHPAILTLIITVLAGLILRWLRPKSRIIWSEPHAFHYLLNRPAQDGTMLSAYVNSLWMSNIGKEYAEGVEVIFNWKPQEVNIWPAIPYEMDTMDDKRYVIRFKTLAPQEWLRIERLDVHPSGRGQAPDVVRVRSSTGGDAQHVSMVPMRTYSKMFGWCVQALMLIGFVAIVYHAIDFVMRLLAAAPNAS